MNSVVIFFAEYGFLFTVLGICIAWLMVAKSQKIRFAASIIGAGVIAFILSRISSHLYYDPRPFVTGHVIPLIPHSADNGFPSDHALLTMTLTAITYFYSKKLSAIMLVCTVFVGASRVIAHVHTPLDIVGGWAFGIIGAIASYYLVNAVWRKHTTKPN